MARIGLFGGSFDPPHFGHVMTITAALNSGHVDEVWLVPSGHRIDKSSAASAEQRKAMIAIMLATMFGSKVPVFLDTTQIDEGARVSTTLRLWEEVKARHPQHTFWLIIGSDLIPELAAWHQAEKLLSKARFLIMPRPGFEEVKAKRGLKLRYIEDKWLALTNISSSMVRDLVRKGTSLEGIVPPAVISHIVRYNLYSPNLYVQNEVSKKRLRKTLKPVKAKRARARRKR